MATTSAALSALKSRLESVVSLGQVAALVEWDQQTYMPKGASESKGRQLAVLSRLAHEMFTDDETGELLQTATRELHGANYDSFDASLVRVAQLNYERARKLPADFVAEYTRLRSQAHEIWVKARAANDFAAFAPTLQQLFTLARQEADLRGWGKHPYDALIGTYEPGVTAADVEGMFADLRTDLIPLVAAIRERADSVDDSCLHQPFDEAKQQVFAEMVIADYGFDFARGRQDRSVHPFCTSFSRDDVRLTTRFDPNWLNPAMFGTFHEAGHGMYEQGSNADLEGSMLCGGTSLGVHESQSRMWENVVGRSRGFWQQYYPKLQATFPAQLGSVPLDTFYRAINKVSPSFIRVEADEATYNLHIMIRFELEMALLDGSLLVQDLPTAWNDKFKAYLGIVPPTDALGVLQDVHWSAGLIGYFPTYSMGNLLSVQLFDKAVAAYPTIPTQITEGKFSDLLGWMREHIHQHGAKYQPKELIERATGEPMQSRSYMRYLKAKYSDIYGL